MKLLVTSIGILALALGASAQKTELAKLPPAVQKTVQDNLKGATIKSINKEKEDGVTQYEVETTLNGKARNFDVDTKGTLLVVEEESSIDAVPAPVKATIMQKVGAGKLTMVETYQKPGKELMYEAGITSKFGKKSELLVKADGTVTK